MRRWRIQTGEDLSGLDNTIFSCLHSFIDHLGFTLDSLGSSNLGLMLQDPELEDFVSRCARQLILMFTLSLHVTSH